MTDPAWKKVERKVARYLSPRAGRRTPLSGRNSGHGTSADVLLPRSLPLYVEVKHGKRAEAILRSRTLLLRLFEDTEQKALGEGKVPVVVLHPPRWGNGGVATYPAWVRHEVCRPSAAIGTEGHPALLLPLDAVVCVPLSELKRAAVEER